MFTGKYFAPVTYTPKYFPGSSLNPPDPPVDLNEFYLMELVGLNTALTENQVTSYMMKILTKYNIT